MRTIALLLATVGLLSATTWGARPRAQLSFSNDGKILYFNWSPLHYTSERKGYHPIVMSQGFSQQGKWSPMKMVLYGFCDNAKYRSSLKKDEPPLTTRVVSINFLMGAHPDERKAVSIYSVKGLFRALGEAIRDGPWFEEEGTISLLDNPEKSWPVSITRADVAFYTENSNYEIVFSQEDSPEFIRALKSGARPQGQVPTPQTTLVLKSPRLKLQVSYLLTPPAVNGINRLISCDRPPRP